MSNTMETLRLLFDKIQSTSADGPESLSTDNTRQVAYGPNSTKGKAQVQSENAQYIATSTSNKAQAQIRKNLRPIDNATEMAQYKAQVQHESGGKLVDESGYYSTPARISKIFGKDRLQGVDPKTLTKNSEALLNTVYGGKWGKANLGNTETGDGYKYRGRGLIQITGKANYKKYGDMIGEDLVSNPDRALDQEVADKVSLAYWNDRVKPNIQDFSDTKGVTRLINGGTHGLKERESLFKKYNK